MLVHSGILDYYSNTIKRNINLVHNHLGLAMEWANLHKTELLENWNMVQKDGTFFKIEPLA
jgi:hypothetical protein